MTNTATRLGLLSWLSVIVVLPACTCCSGAEQSPIAASACDVQQHPAQYNGKRIAVRASVIGRKELSIFDFEADGCTGPLRVVIPEESDKKPSTKLVRDSEFAKFEAALRTRSAIQAVLEGTFEWRGRAGESRKKESDNSMKLLLEKVYDVRTTPTRSVDR